MFLSVSGISFYKYDDELEAKYVARRLMSYGIPPSGDLTSDKQTLKKLEAGEKILPVEKTEQTNTELHTGATERSNNSDDQLAILNQERNGANQIAILMKLKHGLL